MKPIFIFGVHSITAVLASNPANVVKVYCEAGERNKRVQQLVDLAEGLGIKIDRCEARQLDSLAKDETHQGLVAEYLDPGPRSAKRLLEDLRKRPEPWLILALDGVTDPHNLGACLRSADAMAVDAVITPKDNSAGLTPVVQKVAAGAAVTVPFYQVPNLARVLTQLKEQGAWVFGAAGEATGELQTVDFKSSTVLVMGSEGSGMRRLTREACDDVFKIPMHGTVESLNVSVATGIALYEIQRQRAINPRVE